MSKIILSAFADEYDNSFEEQMKGLSSLGIGYVEVRGVDGKNVSTLTRDEVMEAKAKLDAYGIGVSAIGSPLGKVTLDSDLSLHFETARRVFETANVLGTKYIRMFSFYAPEGKNIVDCKGEAFDALGKLVDLANSMGVTLCHENESHIYGQMPKEVNDLLTSVPALGGIFDAANYRMHDADVIEGIKATFNNFKYMHIKDAIFASQEVVPAGEGEGKIAEILNYIDENTDAEVFLTLEPHLRVFGVYNSIDTKELKGKHHFETSRESFDFAANALKNLLTDLGFKECDGKWTR